MAAWGKIDALRDRVARTTAVELAPGSFSSLRGAQGPDRLVILGWEIFLSRRRQGGAVHWHLSAKLHPHARPVMTNDWEIVGRIAARVGAPPDPALVPSDPRAALHWSWREA
jgi:hypothetical protein